MKKNEKAVSVQLSAIGIGKYRRDGANLKGGRRPL
jgi:hypothetical protein